MAELELKNVVKIYPFVDVKKHFFDRKSAQKKLDEQRSMPYVTNEGVIAVQKFNLSINTGEFVVLYGPSGCGKSTVLRMIAGLEDVTAGELLIDGENQEGINPEDRDVAMVFQTYSLYPHFTVEDNIAFPLRNLHIPREELQEKVDAMIRLLELEKVRKSKPDTLSGGEMQRTAIGRALIRRPKLFLMDEPFSNLDAPLRMKLRVLVKKIHQQMGTTFIYVTHDMYEALSLADKLVLMKDGMIVQQGTPSEIYSSPANITAASMIGAPAVNLFEDAEISEKDGAKEIALAGNRFILPEQFSRVQYKKCTAGIRPVHMRVRKETEAGYIPADVLLAENVGKEIHLTLSAGGKEIRAVVKAEEDPYAYRIGQMLYVQPDLNELLLFDSESERKISY